DNARDLRRVTDDITRTVRAGERWRADIRRSSGRITVETDLDGQLVRIPSGTNEVLYAFTAGAVGRKLLSADRWTMILPKVKTSSMEADNRTHVKAWRWEVELVPVRAKAGCGRPSKFDSFPRGCHETNPKDFLYQEIRERH